MYKIAICDDEGTIRSQIRESLQQDFSSINMEIKEYEDGRELLYDIKEDQFYFDIILLDISMKKIGGLTAGEIIRRETICSSSIIMFITSYQADISAVVDINPMAYMYKPIDRNILAKRFGEAFDKLDKGNDIFKFKENRSTVCLKINQIVYIEAHSKYIDIHTQSDIFSTNSYQMGNVIEQGFQKNHNLIRIHNSYIINIDYVKVVKATQVILYNGQELPVSRKYSKELMMWCGI